ncbi:MAG: hypothetical protein P8H03_06770 [Emcibacteraceae bacterium]|nr:hypothetical protein [Emcibacteraceae bacterium]
MIRKVSFFAILLSIFVQNSYAQDLSREQYNWMLNCQGCHGAEGKVAAIDTPVINDSVGRFLNVEGGREYLVSVPGVVNAPISDKDKADLMTWIINSFDPDHKPNDFKPFTEEEMTWGKNNPLRTRAADKRLELLEYLKVFESGDD